MYLCRHQKWDKSRSRDRKAGRFYEPQTPRSYPSASLSSLAPREDRRLPATPRWKSPTGPTRGIGSFIHRVPLFDCVPDRSPPTAYAVVRGSSSSLTTCPFSGPFVDRLSAEQRLTWAGGFKSSQRVGLAVGLGTGLFFFLCHRQYRTYHSHSSSSSNDNNSSSPEKQQDRQSCAFEHGLSKKTSKESYTDA